jgi:tryptophan-rich sensory protein
MKLVNLAKLVVSLVVPLLVGFFGSLFTTSESLNNWYANLNKPPFNPPDWIFGPVWTTLYILMGIAAFLVWRKGLDNKLVRLALLLFVIQLALNTLWSPLFFGLRSPLFGLIDIVLLLSAIVLTIICFFKTSLWPALLLIPYLAWVSFAAVLNASIYILNR